MANRSPLTQAEKERIYQGKLQGRTLAELAAEVRCSLACARKWWRRGRDHGRQGLRAPRRGRGCSGILSHFDRSVADKAVALKHSHPRWGPERVLVELQRDPELASLQLPSRSRLAMFFKVRCPECVTKYSARPPSHPRPPDVTGVHELWQLDTVEGLALNGGELVTICDIRDPVGAAIIASRAFVVTKPQYWRKLHWTEVRQVLRDAFTEWHTLPDGVQTDNAQCVAGAATESFPSLFTLWLVGLGIKHRLIRPGQPTDQAHVERSHRTLKDWALNDEALIDVQHAQQALDRERATHNQAFPSHASDCAGRPPLTAHPELLNPRRPYQPQLELALFDLQRAYDYLATFRFQRKVATNGQVSLGKQHYSVGRRNAGQTVQVYFDAHDAQWVFLSEAGEQIVRRPPKNISVQELTGLEPSEHQLLLPVQLTLPCLVA